MEQTVAASKQTRADPSPIKGSFLNSVPSMIMTFGVTVSSKGKLIFSIIWESEAYTHLKKKTLYIHF